MSEKFVFRKSESPEYVADLARTMRSAMTPAEKLLWEQIRKRGVEGTRFRRQRPIGRFIVDFYCAETGLIVEVDGAVHRGREKYDENRDEFLSAGGYTILRFTNDEIHYRMDEVMEKIRWTILEMRGNGKTPQ